RRRRTLGGGGLGELPGDGEPGLVEQLAEALGGVPGRGGRLGAVLLAVEPSLLQRERGGGSHPASVPAVAAPGRVGAADEVAVVERERDLGGPLRRGELRRLLGQIAQVVLAESHVTAADEGDHTVLDHGPGGEDLVPVVPAQDRGGGEQLQGGGGHERGALVAGGEGLPRVRIYHAERQPSGDHRQIRCGGHPFLQVERVDRRRGGFGGRQRLG